MTPTQFSEVRTRVAAANARARAAAEPAIRAVLAAELPPADLPFDPRTEGGKWDDTSGAAALWLLRPEHLPLIPDGTVLVSIRVATAIVGDDQIDDDTRGGYAQSDLRCEHRGRAPGRGPVHPLPTGGGTRHESWGPAAGASRGGRNARDRYRPRDRRLQSNHSTRDEEPGRRRGAQ